MKKDSLQAVFFLCSRASGVPEHIDPEGYLQGRMKTVRRYAAG